MPVQLYQKQNGDTYTVPLEMKCWPWSGPSIRQFCPYLYDKKFTVCIDHNALKWLYSFHEIEGQVASWLEAS